MLIFEKYLVPGIIQIIKIDELIKIDFNIN